MRGFDASDCGRLWGPYSLRDVLVDRDWLGTGVVSSVLVVGVSGETSFCPQPPPLTHWLGALATGTAVPCCRGKGLGMRGRILGVAVWPEGGASRFIGPLCVS